MASPNAPPDMEENPMFVIKNLDTGLEMRIDDFDKLANIATEEVQDDNEQSQKKSGLTKGTKAFKHWTAATAKKATAISKKAVTGIKEAAHDLSIPSLTKHKLPGQQPEPSPSSSRGPGSHLLGSPLSDLLLVRRSTGEHPGHAATGAAEPGKFGSRASLDAASDLSALAGPSSGIQLNREHTAGSSISDSTVASAAAAAGVVGAVGSTSSSAAAATGQAAPPTLVLPALSAPLTAGCPASSSSSAATSAAGAAPHVAAAQSASAAAAAGAATSAAVPGPVVPAAVRLVSHKRSRQQVQDVVLAQVLETSCGVVWVVAFSRDGSFLAAAGQDCVLRVWQLTASRDKALRTNWVYHPPAVPRRSSTCDSSQAGDEAAAAAEEQQQHQKQHLQQQQDDSSQQLGAEPVQQHGDEPQQQQQQQQQEWQQQESVQPPLVEFGPYFSQQPVRQYVGHTEDILDISWSAGRFILSASLDKSVRLWHLSQPGCLRQFWHTDFVTSVQFHPLDAQRFVSGSIDGKIRVWSVAEQQQGAVLATAQLHQDMVTAVGFSLNGGRVLAGTMRGRVRFYELADKKLEYVAQVDVRNQRGQHASGKKVTGIHAVPGQPQQFLITTNDSRLRLLEGYGIMLKFKGHRNNSTQIRAGLSLDGSQVVCGSDDGWVYVWQLGGRAAAAAGSSRLAVAAQDLQHLAGKNAVYQAFQAHDAGVPVTAVAFAPPGVCDGKPSVLLSHAGGGVVAGSGAGAAADGEGVPVRPGFAGRTVQSILVSGSFGGAIKVHELL